MIFSVWAPDAKSVDRVLSERRIALRPVGGGQWQSHVEEVAYDATAEWLTLLHNGVLAVFNFAGRAQPAPMPSGRWQLLLRSDSKEAVPAKLLPARTSFIYIAEVE
jgi:hypothetical protein